MDNLRRERKQENCSGLKVKAGPGCKAGDELAKFASVSCVITIVTAIL